MQKVFWLFVRRQATLSQLSHLRRIIWWQHERIGCSVLMVGPSPKSTKIGRLCLIINYGCVSALYIAVHE